MFIKFDKVVELSTEHLDIPKINYKRNHVEARCPFCGDSKTKKHVRRFYIDIYKDTYVYKCFRCGESGNIISLYSYFKNCSYEESKKYLTDKKYDSEKLKNRLTKNNSFSTKEDIIIDGDLDIDLKNDCYSLDDTPDSIVAKNAINKLKKFKVERKIPDNFPIYIAHRGKYQSRIIIPIYIDNKLVYFQGRSLYDDITPKYLNPKVAKNKIILNIDNFDSEKYIIVCEGIIDAYMVGNQGTCVIGGYVDTSFINQIEKYTNKGIIICLDNPKIDENSYYVLKKMVFENINRYKENIKFFIMPDNYNAKDLNMLATEYNIENMYEFVVENSKNILYTKQFFIK